MNPSPPTSTYTHLRTTPEAFPLTRTFGRNCPVPSLCGGTLPRPHHWHLHVHKDEVVLRLRTPINSLLTVSTMVISSRPNLTRLQHLLIDEVIFGDQHSQLFSWHPDSAERSVQCVECESIHPLVGRYDMRCNRLHQCTLQHLDKRPMMGVGREPDSSGRRLLERCSRCSPSADRSLGDRDLRESGKRRRLQGRWTSVSVIGVRISVFCSSRK
jgi:hypothetical protein